MVLTLHPEHLQTIRNHAMSAYPEECCGLLIGRLIEEGKTLVEVWPAENAWSSEAADRLSAETGYTKECRYAIAPEILLKAQKETRNRQLTIIGIYHSHTDNPAIPSECDREYAWPEYSYIIVSAPQGQAQDVRCWTLDEAHQFQPEEILTSEPTQI